MSYTSIIVLAIDKQPIGAIEKLTIKEFTPEGKLASVNSKLEITRMRFSRERLKETFQDSKFHVAAQKWPMHIVIMEDKVETIRATNVWLSAVAASFITDEWIVAEGIEAECESVTGTIIYESSGE